jgi:hypothetical protein
VLNDYLVPAEEISRFVDAWNGIPLPLGHPRVNDLAVSANTPEYVEQSLGRFWNARFEHDRLQGELWVDVERCTRLGGDALAVLERLRAGQPLEVSTAYWAYPPDDTAGIHNGRAYIGIHRNLRPDHLALLPNDVGACCWSDGCGAPRVNAQGPSPGDEQHQFRSFFQLLRGFFSGAASSTPACVEASAVPAASDDAPDDPQPVAALQATAQETDPMPDAATPSINQQELAARLIANARSGVREEHRAQLETVSEPVLQALCMAAEETPAVQAQQQTEEDVLNGITNLEMREYMSEALATHRARRRDVVQQILAHQHNTFTQPELDAMSTSHLDKLARLAVTADYRGRGGPATNTSEEDEAPPPPPTMQRIMEIHAQRRVS